MGNSAGKPKSCATLCQAPSSSSLRPRYTKRQGPPELKVSSAKEVMVLTDFAFFKPSPGQSCKKSCQYSVFISRVTSPKSTLGCTHSGICRQAQS